MAKRIKFFEDVVSYKPKTPEETQGKSVLLQLIKDGHAWWDESSHAYIGKASDGVEVQLGMKTPTILCYLATYPSPNDW